MISLSTCCLSRAQPGCPGDSDRLPSGLLHVSRLLPLRSLTVGEHSLAASSGTAERPVGSSVRLSVGELELPWEPGLPNWVPNPDILTYLAVARALGDCVLLFPDV